MTVRQWRGSAAALGAGGVGEHEDALAAPEVGGRRHHPGPPYYIASDEDSAQGAAAGATRETLDQLKQAGGVEREVTGPAVAATWQPHGALFVLQSNPQFRR